jgi:transcription-repair coupling factor (superfamily II helicase)
MSLRPLLEVAAGDERFGALADAGRSGRPVEVHMSAAIRPYLLAALVDAGNGLAGRPCLIVAADDIAARDLARELRSYLAPRRVRLYPSRGTGYVSHLAPPPHLVGLRIAALDALTG